MTVCFQALDLVLIVSGISASRYKVAITKQKDLEQTSSSLYNQNNIWSPTVDFSKYIDDNESIVDQVCWIPCAGATFRSCRQPVTLSDIYAGPSCLGHRWLPPHPPRRGHSQHCYRGQRWRRPVAAPQLL